MEGILWKWTNYWSGWQPRWFVLDNGVLSYYKSQEEVNQGCKGSIKMSVCEINVHPTDTTRLDLVIPTEQHFYLKSATTQERQQWLVALGSAKASLGVRQKKDSSTHKTAPDTLKVKKSELRLYCDLLMQQVHTVKTTATGTRSLDDEALNEATSLLGATCDTFIKTLEECMKLANANFAYELPHQLIADSALPPSAVAMTSNNSHIKNNRTIHRSSSADRTLPTTNVHFRDARSNSVEHYEIRQRQPSVEEEPTEHKPQSICLTDDHVPSDQEFLDAQDMNGESSDRYLHHSPDKSKVLHKESSDHENNNHDEMATVVRKTPQIETFFSNLKVSFLNMKLKDDGGIPTKHFLESCAIVITIFEMFGSPIFIPMKSDVMGNLKKIRTKHNIDTKRFDTLQSIVLYEMEMETTAAKDSATDALMWLKRGLEFVYEFLLEFSRGNPDLKLACLNAYNRSLKQYHGWIIRGIITTATRTVPSRQEVLTKLAVNLNDVNNPNYDDELKMDAQRFIKAMSTIIRILNDFYMENSLDKKEVV